MAYIVAILLLVIVGLVWAQGITKTNPAEIKKLKEDEET